MALSFAIAPALAQGTVGAPAFVTHDQPTQDAKRRDFWADTKTPGDGRVYVFGTADVQNTDPNTALFSDRSVAPSTSLLPYTQIAVRQIAVLQINSAVDQFNSPQRYLYGITNNGEDLSRATNGRGISVWRGGLLASGDPDHANTRIAVCGETFDTRFPLSQAPGGNTVGVPNHSSGFVAVYDGNANLLWTHHFFGLDPERSLGDCAITDVSVRVEEIEGVLYDVVTYCGISSHGVPNSGGVPIANGALTPVLPFVAPVPAPATYTATDGATDNGVSQWDGIVGRLVRRHDATGTTTTSFHSVVGGAGQDGFFGIAEIDNKRFIVVGSTANSAGFPFTKTTFDPATPNCVGVQMVFRDGVGSALVLEDSLPIGTALACGTPPAACRHTVARDVHVQVSHPFEIPASPSPATFQVVGSTDDPDLFASVGLATGFGSLQGPSDGFLLGGYPIVTGTLPPVDTKFAWGAYHGGDRADGLTGVNAWSEFTDHTVVAGFRQATVEEGTDQDFEIGSYYLQHPSGGGVVLTPLRRVRIGGPSDIERPAAMAVARATSGSTYGLQFEEFNLGDPAGGGVAVDQQGRVNVVGATDEVGMPVTGATPVQIAGRTFAANAGGPREDGVRIVHDLLPPGFCRTDGTGDQSLLPAALPLAEETTPRCPLSPFGNRPHTAAPLLQRMLIHYEGSDPAHLVTDGAIVVTRPPSGSSLLGTVLQLGFPDPAPTVLPDGMHIWVMTGGPILFPSAGIGDRSFRFALGSMPPGPVSFSAQLFCVLAAGVPGGSIPGSLPCNSSVAPSAASPALYLSY